MRVAQRLAEILQVTVGVLVDTFLIKYYTNPVLILVEVWDCESHVYGTETELKTDESNSVELLVRALL